MFWIALRQKNRKHLSKENANRREHAVSDLSIHVEIVVIVLFHKEGS